MYIVVLLLFENYASDERVHGILGAKISKVQQNCLPFLYDITY